MTDFVAQICQWQVHQGRHGLPWQHTQDPYRIWLSEIMLQQTQVATVVDYYLRFIERFPTLRDLANATLEEVLTYWAGLGYYARGRNLHRCAQIIQEKHHLVFPSSAEEITALPGIGQSTAHAIMAFCYQTRVPIMDGNVQRVFTRYFGISGDPSKSQVKQQLWQQAYEVLDNNQTASIQSYTQGLMDLGATVCKRSKPDCIKCPLTKDCYAHKHQKQTELPQRKVRKTIPTKQVCLLIVQHKQQVLLEQRPNHGIWGGMHSLPEFKVESQLQQYVLDAGLEQKNLQKMAAFEHVFSHYKLQATPYLLVHSKVPPAQQTIGTSPLIWQDLNDLNEAPLPSPIFNLLSHLPS